MNKAGWLNMFSKTRENYEQEFVSLRKRADKFEQQASVLRDKLGSCQADLKTVKAELVDQLAKYDNLAAALDAEKKLVSAERQVRAPEHIRGVLENLVLSLETVSKSIEVERAAAAATEWLENNP
jgi:chromosome segregation ATPase